MDGRRCGQPCRAVLRRCALLLPVVPFGREGAMVQWPQRPVPGLGSWAASRATNYASLLACGAAAGFASAYDAALSGAIFIAEVVYRTLVIRRLVILRAVYPWRNFPHALWVDFQKKAMLYFAARWLETKARNRSEAARTAYLERIPNGFLSFSISLAGCWRSTGR